MSINSILPTGSNHTAQKQVQFDISIFEVKDGRVNLTKICQYFEKNINDWTKTKSAQRYLQAFASKKADTNIIVSLKGGNNEQGSWTKYREVALKLAEWISVDFELWANEQLNTLLTTGKVTLQSKPANSLEASKMLANEVLRLCAQVEQKQAIVKTQEQMIANQNDTNIGLVNLKAKEFKTVQTAVKDDIGKEINYYVLEVFLESAKGIFSQAHLMARTKYLQGTRYHYLGAKSTSLETKKHYLQWLRTQVAVPANLLIG